MFYQSFREQKARGSNKEERFNKTTHSEILVAFVAHQRADTTGAGYYPTPKNPVSQSTFDQYKATFRLIYKSQKTKRVLSSLWDEIWLTGLDDLHAHVKERKAAVKKQTQAEKVSGEFALYSIVERHDNIEQVLWNDISSAGMHCQSVCCGLRHRHCLLHLTRGILRCESLYRAELSDFIGLRPPQREHNVNPMFPMINQISIGKTTHGGVQCGQATRHGDPKLCCVGALSMYLQCRFFCTEEFGAGFPVEDWLDNEKWFDIKLLSDVHGCDNTKMMQNDLYSKHLKKLLTLMGLASIDLLLLGRKLGPKVLEFLEEENEEIKRMGQWSPGVYDNSYSTTD